MKHKRVPNKFKYIILNVWDSGVLTIVKEIWKTMDTHRDANTDSRHRKQNEKLLCTGYR